MARQAGIMRLEGTIDGLTFYKMGGIYYVRTKSSLNRKRILRDPKFKRFRECSKVFGRASRLASRLYRLFPKELKKHGVIGKLTGEFNLLFREGKTSEQAIELMMKRYLNIVTIKEEKKIEKPTIKSIQPLLSNSFINAKGMLIYKTKLTFHNNSPVLIPPLFEY